MPIKPLLTALFCFCFLNPLLANDTVNLTGKITLLNTEEGLFYAIQVPKPVTKTVEGETLTTDVLQLVILDDQLYEKKWTPSSIKRSPSKAVSWNATPSTTIPPSSSSSKNRNKSQTNPFIRLPYPFSFLSKFNLS